MEPVASVRVDVINRRGPSMKRILKNSLICIFVLWLLMPNKTYCQDFKCSAHVESNFILLKWTKVAGAKGYNVYRKIGDRSYQKINSRLISKKTGSDILNILTVSHPEWPAISQILSTQTYKITQPTEVHNDPPGLSIGEIEARESLRQLLSLLYFRFALVMGQAYQDTHFQNGVTYTYKIGAVDSRNAETAWTTEIMATGGKIVSLSAPTNVWAQAGDRKVLILWDGVSTVSGYDLFRDTNPVGTFSNKVTGYSSVMTRISLDLEGNPLTQKPFGYLDTTVVNGTTYYYKVAARDLYGQPGPKSAAVSVTPKDMTPPTSPQLIIVESLQDALKVSWKKVTEDISGFQESVGGYQIYRYLDFDSAMADTGAINLGLIPQPMGEKVIFIDNDPNIVLEKVYWYRVSCMDTALPPNESAKSAATSGYLKDLNPPDRPNGLQAKGFDDHILLEWNKNKEKDCAGYLIYKGICDNCSTFVKTEGNQKIYKIAPCQLSLLGDISHQDSTENMDIEYKDFSIPKDSPICYRYALKAYDKSQNLSAKSDSVCQRLRDTTGPPAPVIAGLKARDRAILIEWIASPIQDLAGFYVERSTSKDGKYQVVSDPLKLPEKVDCKILQANPIKKDILYSFTDKKVEPKKTYWYQVRAVDLDGNPGKEASAALSTFTFQMEEPPQPTDLSLEIDKEKCAVVLKWKPVFDPEYMGFALFRSLEKDKGYRQLNSVIQGNKYIDKAVKPGSVYWYRVQYFDKKGNRSKLSDTVSINVTKQTI